MNNLFANSNDLIDAPDFTVASGSGRASWDERGNSIWEWQTAPGVFSREISSQQLRALEANLSLLDAPLTQGVLWTRAARARPLSARADTHMVLPVRRSPKKSGFDNFLKRLGLPA